MTAINRFFMLLMACASICASAAVVRTDSLATSLVPDSPVAVTVITPGGYAPTTSFPTVYLLNGYSGNNRDWWQLIRTDLDSLADKYGMVMVMPDGRDSWYWDSPERPEMKMESFIINELVPYIDMRYPTIADSNKRAITGLSMGGHGAMWLAFRHPDVFGSVGSMSGGVDIRPFPKNWKMAQWLGPEDENPQAWEEHTVINLVPSLAPGQVNIIFDCGTDDFFAQVNENMHQALLNAGIEHDYTSRPGAHTRKYWANSILYHLLFFNQAFSR